MENADGGEARDLRENGAVEVCECGGGCEEDSLEGWLADEGAFGLD